MPMASGVSIYRGSLPQRCCAASYLYLTPCEEESGFAGSEICGLLHREAGSFQIGEVSEWPIVPDSKSGVRETVPWVQIPPSPPSPALAGFGGHCPLKLAVAGV